MKKIYCVFAAVILSLAMIIPLAAPATACNNDKNSVHFAVGAGQYDFDLSRVPGWSGHIGGNFEVAFKEPGDGFYRVKITYGCYKGSWANTQIKEAKIGTIDGHPAAFFWGQIKEGENFYTLDPKLPPLPAYQNLTGWYKVGIFVNGGVPGRDKDYYYVGPEIPPEGFPYPPFVGIPGAALAKAWYDMCVAGTNVLAQGLQDVTRGNIVIK